MLRLTKKWVDKLVALPESGMGYQIVDIALKDGRVLKEVIILGSKHAQIPEVIGKITVNDIAKIAMSK